MNPCDVFPALSPAEAGFDPAALEEVYRFIEAELAVGRFPGAQLAVMRNGHTVVQRTWGTYCSAERRDAPYHPGVLNCFFSFTKGISATVLVIAKQKGLLDYDEPVWHAIPEFRQGGKEAITLRHLMTHSAGIPNAPLGWVATEEGWREGVRACCAHPLEWEPGSKTAYHALSGLFVAGEVLRRAMDNKPWPAICRELLFEPLGAETLTFETPPATAELALTPQPETLPGSLSNEVLAFLGHPAGGCLGNSADMLRVLALHLNGGVWQGRRLIEPEAYAEMHTVQYAAEIQRALDAGETPQHEYWGLGWLLRGRTQTGWFGFGCRASERSFGHAGIDTVMTVGDPERQLAIVFLTTNSPKPSEETTRLRNTVTNLVVEALRAE